MLKATVQANDAVAAGIGEISDATATALSASPLLSYASAENMYTEPTHATNGSKQLDRTQLRDDQSAAVLRGKGGIIVTEFPVDISTPEGRDSTCWSPACMPC
jgi:hypothetical protein